MTKTEYSHPRHNNLHEVSKNISSEEIIVLEKSLETSWSAETMLTAEQKDFDKNDPAYSQCFVTAMVVQYLLGGEIVQGFIPEDPENVHAWNILPDGSNHDFDRKQFPAGFNFEPLKTRSTQSLIESQNALEAMTLKRFLLLLDRVFQNLPEEYRNKWFGEEYVEMATRLG